MQNTTIKRNKKGHFIKGSKRPKEWIEKLASSLRGKPKYITGETKEKISKTLSGRKMPEYQRIKLSEYNKRIGKMPPHRKGEDHYNWKGGITPLHEKIRKSEEYKLWRKSVFERDNYTCVWCGDSKGGNLHADHIKPFCLYPELRFAIDNGRTLCSNCHKTTDTWGRKATKYK